jgi:hypothetical protein
MGTTMKWVAAGCIAAAGLMANAAHAVSATVYIGTAPSWQHGYTQGAWVDTSRYGWDRHYGAYRGRDRARDGIDDRWDRDLDNDGRPNHRDRDMDGDGVPNRWDRAPTNRRRY